MGRDRVATSVLENRGAFNRHPERKAERANEPIATGELGEPPARLAEPEKEAWLELASIVPPKVLANADRWTVEIAVKLMAEFRGGKATIGKIAQLCSLLSKMGMTPADRSRVKLPTEKSKSEWEDLADTSETPNDTRPM